jgi:hypothetical protein
MPEDSYPKSEEKSQSENKTQGINPLLITGLLAILGTVAGEVIKGYWSNTLADKDFQSKLVLDALEADDEDARKKALEFLVTTNLISDPKIQKGVNRSTKDDNVPQFQTGRLLNHPLQVGPSKSVPPENLGVDGQFDASGLSNRVTTALEKAGLPVNVDFWVTQTGSTVVIKYNSNAEGVLEQAKVIASQEGATSVTTQPNF